MSVPFSKNCYDPVGTDVMDSTADFTTVCTECRIEGGMKLAISTRAKQNNSCVFYSSFCNCTKEKTDDDFELSLSLSLFYAPHTKEKKRKEVSLSLSLSRLWRAHQPDARSNECARFFLVSENNTGVD